MTNKELNYVMICGVIKKVKRNSFTLDFNRGVIKVNCRAEDCQKLGQGYTVHIGGFLSKKPFRRINIEAFNVSIFDREPHTLF